jgi:hypothetical protein
MDYVTLPVAVFLGLLAPVLISTLKQRTWPTWAKMLITLGVSFGFAALAVFTTQQELATWADMLQATTLIFTVATVYYKTFFEGTWLNEKATDVFEVVMPTVPTVPTVPTATATATATATGTLLSPDFVGVVTEDVLRQPDNAVLTQLLTSDANVAEVTEVTEVTEATEKA